MFSDLSFSHFDRSMQRRDATKNVVATSVMTKLDVVRNIKTMELESSAITLLTKE